MAHPLVKGEICADLSARPMLYQGTEVALSASIGLALCVDGASDASALIARADAALYRAKVQGRNRVVVAAAPE
jgi:diguanylate cyclase (GGDEF)-like protein